MIRSPWNALQGANVLNRYGEPASGVNVRVRIGALGDSGE